MNIFAISGCEQTGTIDWEQSARELDNYRVVKMILESCQMLCTTLNHQGFETPYRNAHFNHPSTKWVRESSANFLNLVKHTEAMLAEYKFDDVKAVEAAIVKYMETNGKRIQELSLRMAIKLAELIKMRPQDWESVANVTCLKRGA